MKRTATARTTIAGGIAAPRVRATILRRRPARAVDDDRLASLANPYRTGLWSCACVRQRRDQRVLAAQLGLLGERPHGGNPHARRYSAGISGWDGPMPSRSKREKPAVSCRFGGGAGGARTRDQRIMSPLPSASAARRNG